MNPDTSSSTAKTETVPRRIAIPADTDLSNETKDSSANNNNNNNIPSSTKSTTRSVITDSPKVNSEETPTPQTRLVVNRNVVIGESTNNPPTRTIVQTAPSSNRIVVSSNTIESSSKGKKTEIDSVEEKIATKKFKSDSKSGK